MPKASQRQTTSAKSSSFSTPLNLDYLGADLLTGAALTGLLDGPRVAVRAAPGFSRPGVVPFGNIESTVLESERSESDAKT